MQNYLDLLRHILDNGTDKTDRTGTVSYTHLDVYKRQLLNIVKDLDMINQFESGEITLNISKFDINNLIREIIDLLDLEAQKKNSKVVLQSSSPQIFVNADKQKISQVLINLISNAIHYANRELAKITVKTCLLYTSRCV